MPTSRKAKGRPSSPVESPIEAPVPSPSQEVQGLYLSLGQSILDGLSDIDIVRNAANLSVAQAKNDMKMALSGATQSWHDYIDAAKSEAIDALSDARESIQREIDHQIALGKGQLSIGGMDMHQASQGILIPPHTPTSILSLSNRYTGQAPTPDIWRGPSQPSPPVDIGTRIPGQSQPVSGPDLACWPIGLPPWRGFGEFNHPICGNRYGIFLDQSLLASGAWSGWFQSGKWYICCIVTTGYEGIRCVQYTGTALGLPVNPFYLLGGPFSSREDAKVCYDCGGGGIDIGQPPTPPTPPTPPPEPPTPPPECPVCGCCSCQCTPTQPPEPPEPQPDQCIPEDNVEIQVDLIGDGTKKVLRKNKITGQIVDLPNCPPPQSAIEEKYKAAPMICQLMPGIPGNPILKPVEPAPKEEKDHNAITYWKSWSWFDLTTLGAAFKSLGFFWKWLIGDFSSKNNGIAVKAGEEAARLGKEVLGCSDETYFPMVGLRSALGFTTQWLGVRADEVDRTITYVINATCQSVLPSANEASQAYMADTISYDDWERLTKLNGLCIPWAKPVMESAQARPNPFESVQLLNRGVISDDIFAKLMRNNGYLNPLYVHYAKELSTYIPGPGDLVSFMTRDVFDPKVVAEYRLDSEFDRKYQGKAKEWAKAQGMSEDVFRAYWRAHWQMPSPQQLYEMLHRLRPGDVADELAVTEKDVFEALGVQDYSPVWRERLMGISYHPLTRIDARHAYTEGIIDRKGMLSALYDEGYSKPNAEIMFKLADLEKTRNEAAHFGMITAKEAIHDYSTGLMSKDELFVWLKENKVRPEIWADIVISADTRRKLASRSKCISSIEKRYDYYEMDRASAVSQLIDLGIDHGQAIDLVEGWTCHRDSRSKMVSAASLCTFFQEGLLSGEEYYLRLLRIGYSEESATLIMADCKIKLQEKLLRKVEKIAREEARLAEKQKREAERRAKQKAKEEKERLKQRLSCMSDEDREAYESAQCQGLDSDGNPSMIQ